MLTITTACNSLIIVICASSSLFTTSIYLVAKQADLSFRAARGSYHPGFVSSVVAVISGVVVIVVVVISLPSVAPISKPELLQSDGPISVLVPIQVVMHLL
jgi:hypothetical protein